MPRPVEQVPDPWAPYKDGQIWEFTKEEWEAMPATWPLASRPVDRQVIGERQMMWYVDGKVYTRFFTDEVYELHPGTWPEYLAGWGS